LEALGVVDEAGEHDNAEHQEEHEESELFGGRPEGVHQDLEVGGVAGELEKPEDPDDGEELQCLGRPEQRVGVEGQRGGEVDQVHGRLDELDDIRAYLETKYNQ